MTELPHLRQIVSIWSDRERPYGPARWYVAASFSLRNDPHEHPTMSCRCPPLAFGCLALVVALAASAPPAAFAQQPDFRALRQTPAPSKPQPSPVRPREKTSCAEFGTGFVRAPGSDTCVRAGGAIDIGVGATRR